MVLALGKILDLLAFYRGRNTLCANEGETNYMPRPRIFISSTCYDLSKIRSRLTRFLGERGFEVINSEKTSFAVKPKVHSHAACLDQVENADYFLLIIGTRRGSNFKGSKKSITNQEFNHAMKMSIPVIAFLDKNVEAHRNTYKKNPAADFSHVVDDKRVFTFIDYVGSGHEDNWLHIYESIEDIEEILTSQFAYYLLLYSRGLRKKEDKIDRDQMPFVDFPSNLGALNQLSLDQDEITTLRNGLRQLHRILAAILSSSTKQSSKEEKLHCLWIISKFGTLKEGEYLEIDNDVFKDYAWSSHKGNRVFNQLKEFGVSGQYITDEYEGTESIRIRFKEEDTDTSISWALVFYTIALIREHGDDGYKVFQKADMRIFME